MRKSIIFSGFSALIFFIFSGCATLRVTVNYDREARFSAYKNFKVVTPKPARSGSKKRQIRNPLFTKDIIRAIVPALTEKGFKEVKDKSSADFLVIFYASVKNRTDWVPPTYHVGRWGRVYNVTPGRPVRFKEGTLVIDIVDRKTKELVWQGIGSDVLDPSGPHENLINAVQEILKKFPPDTSGQLISN